MILTAAMLACATNVHPVTLQKVVEVERGEPLALNVNRYSGQQPHPRTTGDAVALVRAFVAAGYSVDMGPMQINTANLPHFNVAIEDVLGTDEAAICRNIKIGGLILGNGYGRAAQRVGDGQAALFMALSDYNTGTFTKGFTNGYVARYVPNISLARLPTDNPYTAATEVYARYRADLVIH